MNFQELTDDQVLAIAEPLMDNLMDGSNAIDHARHTRDFTDRLKSYVTAEKLEAMCREHQARIGKFTHREVMGVVRRQGSAVIIWKEFATLTEDTLVSQMVLVESSGRYLVDHALVF